MKKGSAVALPSGTHYGAHVAPQRCTILRNGKAVISYHIRGAFYPLKFKIVLDMGYTSPIAPKICSQMTNQPGLHGNLLAVGVGV